MLHFVDEDIPSLLGSSTQSFSFTALTITAHYELGHLSSVFITRDEAKRRRKARGRNTRMVVYVTKPNGL